MSIAHSLCYFVLLYYTTTIVNISSEYCPQIQEVLPSVYENITSNIDFLQCRYLKKNIKKERWQYPIVPSPLSHFFEQTTISKSSSLKTS